MSLHQRLWITVLLSGLSINLYAFTLEGIYPIKNSESMDLSGLAICQGRILTVSDKDSSVIYQIEKQAGTYALIKYRDLNLPKTKSVGFQFPNNLYYLLYQLFDKTNYDLEGIACDSQAIYLASERHAKIGIVSLQEERQEKWTSLDIKNIQEAGLLKKYNAFIEGITIDSKYYYLGVEREPRGVVKIDRNTGHTITKKYEDNLSTNRPADISGMAMWKDELYFLSRNEESICKVDKDALTIIDCYSYESHIQNIKYDSDEFGVVEGMAITDKYVYLVIDNNGMSIKDQNDTRSRLIVLNNDLD